MRNKTVLIIFFLAGYLVPMLTVGKMDVSLYVGFFGIIVFAVAFVLFYETTPAGQAKKKAAQAKLTYCPPRAMARGGHQAMFDESGIDPDIVCFRLLPYQADHVLNDYMAATDRSSLTFNHTPNSAACSGSVWSFVNNTANLTTMCAGRQTSGKSDMSMMNLFIPGSQIKASAAQFLKRITETGGPAVLGKGGQPWPGLDVCKGCPLFRYEAV